MKQLISIREHCIPAYNELSNMNKICEFPAEYANLEQKTAGGIIQKLKRIYHSDYFKKLPQTAVIQSGGNNSFVWNKSETSKEIERIIALK